MTDWQEIDTYAKEWIKEAGDKIRDSFLKTLNVETKSNPNDLVTNIDKATEHFFIGRIKETYPKHLVLGEEGLGDQPKSLSGIVWIIDPIDGTVNFVHQQRNFAISIGIYENGIGKIGLIYDVVNDELYHGMKDRGAFVNGNRLPKLENVEVNKAIIGINAAWVAVSSENVPPLRNLVLDARGTRSYGSAAIEIAYVASGVIDAYITMRLSPWDFAAGLVLLGEVGGMATNLRGDSLDLLLPTNTVFISKPGLHQEVMKTYLENGEW